RWNDREATSGLPVGPDPKAISATDLTTGIVFRAPQRLGIQNTTRALRSRASVSYVTGTHNFKVGVNLARARVLVDNQPPGDYTVSLRSGVPTSITLAGPNTVWNNLGAD